MEAWTKEKALENQSSNHQFVSAHTLAGILETSQVGVPVKINCILNY